MAGAPKGNQNARKAAEWRQAIKHALETYEDSVNGIAKGTALKAIAKKCVQQALEGDSDARQEIANRLDGKVPQALIGGDEDDPPIALAEIVIRAIDAIADRPAPKGD